MKGQLLSTRFTGKRNGKEYFEGFVVKKYVKGKNLMIDEMVRKELARQKKGSVKE